MKHAVGGFGLGFALGLCFIPVSKHKPVQITALAVSMAMATWGLL